MDLIVNQTRDATRSVFNGVPRHVIANTEDDHGRPGMQDYAVEMLALPKLTVLNGVTGAVIASLVDFGTADPDEVVQRTIRLMNSGGGILDIGTLIVAGAAFSLVSGPEETALAAGQHTPVVLQMVSAMTGSMTGTLTIPSNDAASPRVLALAGAVSSVSCHALGVAWGQAVAAAGGTASKEDQQIICGLAEQLAGKSYFEDIWLLMPLVGRNLAAALVPLINRLRNAGSDPEGSMTISATGLTDADFDPEEGMSGATATKYINLGTATQSDAFSGMDPAAVGVGFWQLNPNVVSGLFNWGAGDGRLAGLAPSFVVGLSSTTVSMRRGFQNEATLWDTDITVGAVTGLFDAEHVADAAVTVRRDGVEEGSDASIASPVTVGVRMLLMAWGWVPFGSAPGIEPEQVFPADNCQLGCFYIRGAMSEADVADLYATLRDYLMVPTGRVAP